MKIMLLKRVLGRQTLMALLLVVGLTAAGSAGLVPFVSGSLGPDTVSADTRCHEHYSHTHGWGRWRRTDAWSSHGTSHRPATNQLWHWNDHENSSFKWCFRDENQNGEDD